MGVRFRESDARQFKGKADRYYSIRYSKEGQSVEEPVGWESEGITPQLASQKRGELIQNIRSGEGFTSLKEKREIKQSKKRDEETEKNEEGPYWESVGHSLNLGVNELADVLHTFYLNVVAED